MNKSIDVIILQVVLQILPATVGIQVLNAYTVHAYGLQTTTNKVKVLQKI